MYMFSLTGLPWWLRGKESACECRRHGFNPWVGKIPCRRKWHPLQYFFLGSPTDRGAWQATVHGVTKESDTTEQQILQGVFPLLFADEGACLIYFYVLRAKYSSQNITIIR